MRFPYVALAIKPTQMKCTCNTTDSTYITLCFFLSELNTLGVMLKCYAHLFPKHVWLVGIKSLLTLSTLNSWGFGKQNLLREGVPFHMLKTVFEYVCLK